MTRLSSDPPPKRVKVTLACTICRKKKVKCDGIQPTCSRCQSIGICCQYSDPPKKRGPPKGYVEVIENRAHRIESLLGNQHQQKPNNSISTINKAGSNVSVDNAITTKQQVKDNQPMNALLCLVAGAVDVVVQQEKTTSNPIVHGSNDIIHAFLMPQNVLIDSNEDISTVIWTENFFNHFNFIFPILSRPQFMFQLEKNELNPLLKMAVLALGCRLEGQKMPEEKMLFEQFDRALNASQDIVPDLSSVQSTVIMCWYTYLSGDMHRCYSLRHSLASMVHKLNLGYECNKSHHDIHYTEMKRRAFWVSFVIDQWFASCTGGERLLIQDHVHTWDCKFPQLEDSQLYALFQYKKENIAASAFIPSKSCFSVESALQINSFSHMIKLAKIVGRICDVNANAFQLESSLTEWLLQLPSYLDYGNLNDDVSPSPIAKMYRILYYTVQIMLNKQSMNTSRNLSASICTTAANTIVHISEQMLKQRQHKYLYNVFFLSLTLATSIHLDNTIFNDNNAPDKINLCKSVTLLKELNCSLLPRSDFDRLIDHFLVGRCQIVLDFVYPSPPNSTSNTRPKINNKRHFSEVEIMYSPPSTPPCPQNSIRPSTMTLVPDLTMPFDDIQPQFDLNDIFSIMNEPLFNNDNTANNWQSWADLFDTHTIESSNACSPASYFTPSQSPSLSLNLKEEENIPFDLLSDQQFFTTFSLL